MCETHDAGVEEELEMDEEAVGSPCEGALEEGARVDCGWHCVVGGVDDGSQVVTIAGILLPDDTGKRVRGGLIDREMGGMGG